MPMPDRLPARIRVDQYRCFSTPQDLELRPLTLIYGRNNAGKSALLRLVRLLDATAVPRARAGNLLRLLEPPGEEGSLDRLLPTSSDNPTLQLGLDWQSQEEGHESWDFELEIRGESFQVESLAWSLSAPSATHKESGRIERRKTGYQVDTGALNETIALTFSGLSPDGKGLERVPALGRLRERLSALEGSVSWLQASRDLPRKNLYQPQEETQQRLLPDGSNSMEILVTQRRELLDSVNRWYSGRSPWLRGLKALDGAPRKSLELHDVAGRGFEVRLHPSELEGANPREFQIRLTEAGEGMSHVLPVLLGVELARKQAHAGKPSLLAVEEPESHLHPDAQRALAQHLAGCVQATPGCRVVLETHSMPILLAIQVEVARKNLDHSLVAFHWVESTEEGAQVRGFTLDKYGLPNAPGFPKHAFSEVDLLQQLLIDAQPSEPER